MKKYFILFILAGLLGCAQKPEEPIPASVLSIEKMTHIMVDIQLVEGGLVIKKHNKSQQRDRIKDVYKALFDKHSTTKEKFTQSLRYYTDHPGKLENIYEGMLENLSELEAEVATEKPEPPQVGN